MQKRINPLELRVEESSQDVILEKDNINDFKSEISFEFKNPIKRKFIIGKVSKDVLEILKAELVDQKTSQIIETALLHLLYEISKDDFDKIMKDNKEV